MVWFSPGPFLLFHAWGWWELSLEDYLSGVASTEQITSDSLVGPYASGCTYWTVSAATLVCDIQTSSYWNFLIFPTFRTGVSRSWAVKKFWTMFGTILRWSRSVISTIIIFRPKPKTFQMHTQHFLNGSKLVAIFLARTRHTFSRGTSCWPCWRYWSQKFNKDSWWVSVRD